MKKPNILLLHQGYSSFVKADDELLKPYYSVFSYYIKPSRKLSGFLYQHIKFLLFFAFNFYRFQLIVTWFGDYHTFSAALVSKIFKRKHIVIVGGNDAVSIPEISFGLYHHPGIRSKMVTLAYKMADKIAVVDESLIHGENYYAKGNNKVGLENFVKGISRKCVVIPTGYDAEQWKCDAAQKKKNQVLSVGIVDSEMRAKLKGFDLITQLAELLPKINFIFIGVTNNKYISHFSKKPNLTIIENVSQEKLKEYYCTSKVYAQFSMTEGLPNTLCEAMLSGCIAVGSNVNGIPKLIRNDNFILKEKDIEKAKNIILNAFRTDLSVGTENRDFILNMLSSQKRLSAFQQLINSL
ncbi:MAG: glycosyltransferase [Bacteroidales bacterium]|nr:glycosyltransferase [Bacteroidales bacterium]